MRLTGLIHAVEAHAEGEPARVVVGGVVDVPGATMFEKKLYLERERDSLRRLLLFEPRGQAALSADLVLPATHPEADAGFIIMESADYPAMSGSNTICVVTVLLETGMLPMREPVTELTLEAPAGLVRVRAECRDGRVRRVTFQNLPAYAAHLDAHVEVPGLGTVILDVAYGGVYFAIVEAASVGLRVTPDEAADLVAVGEQIKAAAAEQLPVVHPENPDIHTITFTEFTAPPTHPEAHGKNAVVVSPGRLDRSPCGTGTCARMAVLHARGQLGLEQDFVHESTIGTLFYGRLVGTAQVGPYRGVIPTISGRGWITGIHQYATDPEDPLAEGFTLSDTWGLGATAAGSGGAVSGFAALARSRWLALVPMLIWSTGFVAIDFAAPYSPPLFFAALRIVPAGIALFAVAALRGMLLPPRWAWPWVAAMGLVYMGLQQAGMVIGTRLAGPGMGAVLVSTGPFWTLLLARLTLGEPLGRLKWLSVGVGFLGVLLITVPRASLGGGLGEAVLIFTAICNAVSVVIAKRVGQRLDLLLFSAWQLLVGGSLLVLTSALVEDWGTVRVETPLVLTVIWISLIGTSLPLLIWFQVIRRGEAGRVAAWNFLIPVLGLIWAWLLRGRPPAPMELPGMALAVLGIVLVNLRPAAAAAPGAEPPPAQPAESREPTLAAPPAPRVRG